MIAVAGTLAVLIGLGSAWFSSQAAATHEADREIAHRNWWACTTAESLLLVLLGAALLVWGMI